MRGKKRGQMWETLGPWLIGFILLVLVATFYYILKGKGVDLLTFLKELIKFR